MAAFTYQHPPFHLDSLYLSNDAINKMSDHHQEEDIINNPIIYFPNFSPSDDDHHSLLLPPQEIPLVDHVQNYESINGPCMSDKTKSTSDSSYSSTVVDFEGGIGDQVINQEKTSSTPLMEKNKKRKNRDGSSLESSAVDQSKDGRRGKAKKQKKNEVSSSEVTEEIKCKDDDNKKKKNEPKKIKEDPPTGYVHVRARRGQATDSHSLAERVRREKISERLKMLQGLVPGCDKVNSKALMLDEIINYVQSLQLQVEMLSMKLASMNPIFYDFGADLDAYLFKPEKPSDLALPLPSVPMPSVQQSIPTPSTVFGDLTTTLSTNNNIPLLDSSVPFSLQQEQQQRLLNDFTQKNEEQLWNVGYQRQRFINQLGATNLCFFQ